MKKMLLISAGVVALCWPSLVAGQATLRKVRIGNWIEAVNWEPRQVPTRFDNAFIEASTDVPSEILVEALRVVIEAELAIGKEAGLQANSLSVGSDFANGTLLISGKDSLVRVRGQTGRFDIGNLDVGTPPIAGVAVSTGKVEISEGGVLLLGDSPGFVMNVGVGSSVAISGISNDLLMPTPSALRMRSNLPGRSHTLRLAGTLTVENGGLFEAGGLQAGGTAMVTVADAKIRTDSIRLIGEMLVRSGGAINNAEGTLTVDPATTAGLPGTGLGKLTVQGLFTTVDTFGLSVLSLNQVQPTGRIFVRDGAVFRVSDFATIQAGGSVFVEGANTVFRGRTATNNTNEFSLTIAEAGSVFAVRDGGAAIFNSVEVGSSRGSIGRGLVGTSVLSVSGAGARLEVLDRLIVLGSRTFGPGLLSVSDGGEVTTATAMIGRDPRPGRRGDGSAIIAGAGSLLTVGERLTIGIDALGGPNSFESKLTVSGGGRVKARVVDLGNALIVEPAQARAIIDIGGGEAPGALEIEDDINIGATGILRFNHSNALYFFDTKIESIAFNDGRIEQAAGFTTLTGRLDRFTGRVSVTGGQLAVDTDVGATQARVEDGGRLGGRGSLAGTLTIANGGTLFGGQTGSPLSVTTLVLDEGANVNVGIEGATTAVPIFNVTDSLTLDGILNIDAPVLLGQGLYRIFNFGGSLTDRGLDIGSVPSGLDPASFSIFLGAPGQVDLLYGGGPGGAENRSGNGNGTILIGGDGWTNAQGAPATLRAGDFVILTGPATPIAVDDAGGAVDLGGVQFAATGFALNGDPLTLGEGLVPFRVGDGTEAGAGFTGSIAGPLVGVGGLEKTDLGTLVLTGSNSYAGGTVIGGGVLQVGGDVALGATSGTVTLAGGALRSSAAFSSARALLIDSPGGTLDTGGDAWTLSGSLTGAAPLRKTGIGVLTYSGDGAAFTGRFSVDAGRLALAGRVGGTTLIAAGATLSGTGRLGALDVRGTVAPGNSPGTLTIDGDVTFRAGSTYQVELAAAGAGDRIEVGGSALLEGGTVAVTPLDPELNYTDGATYRILNAADGLSGTFGSLVESSAFLDFALGYDATGATVTVDVIRMFPAVAATPNQSQAAAALMQLDRTAGTDALAVYNQILLLDADPARAAFDAASGELFGGLIASEARRGLGISARLASRAYEGGEGWSVWGGPVGQGGRTSADGNGARATSDGVGGEVGLRYGSPEGRFSGGVGGGWTEGDLTLRARGSRAETDSWHLGGSVALGGGGPGPSATFTLSHIETDAKTSRQIAIGALARTAGGKTKVSTTVVGAELRYGFAVGDWTYGPTASAASASSRLDGFTESGAGALSLSGTGDRARSTQYAAGGFIRHAGSRGTLDATVQYARRDRGRGGVDLALAGSPLVFLSAAARDDRDALLVRGAGDILLGGGWSIGANVTAALADTDRAIAGAAHVAFRF